MPPAPAAVSAIRGHLVYPTGDPFTMSPDAAIAEHRDGLIVIRNGEIEAVGAYSQIASGLPGGTEIAHYPSALIIPGLVDCHVHYVQTAIVGSYGAQLTDWLERYAFPAERAFADPARAAREAGRFCDELVRNGTTTALVFASVHAHAAEVLFAEAERRGIALIAGKVMMDRNAPDDLLDTAQRGYDESKALIARWHGRGRLRYAITPRFAPTSSEAQLDAAAALWREHPGVHVHTHLAENAAEVAWVKRLFPASRSYLDVYDRRGLTGTRAMFAHAIHLDEEDFCRCHESGSALAHCPTSNLFLGSGRFNVARAKLARRAVKLGLGTDIGAGTSFSLLATAGEAYKVAQVGGASLHPAQALYLTTLGGARALDLGDRLGTLAPGLSADCVVLDPAATPLLAQRTERAETGLDMLFAIMALADVRAVTATYAEGRLVYRRSLENNPSGS